MSLTSPGNVWRCSTYENVVVLQTDERAKDCDVVVRASVDGFGSLTFADNSGHPRPYANGHLFVQNYGRGRRGGASARDLRVLPGCVDETYALTFSLDDVSCGICRGRREPRSENQGDDPARARVSWESRQGGLRRRLLGGGRE